MTERTHVTVQIMMNIVANIKNTMIMIIIIAPAAPPLSGPLFLVVPSNFAELYYSLLSLLFFRFIKFP